MICRAIGRVREECLSKLILFGEPTSVDFDPAEGFPPRIVLVIDSQVRAFRDRLFGARTGRAGCGLQGFDLVSTCPPRLESLPDPIP